MSLCHSYVGASLLNQINQINQRAPAMTCFSVLAAYLGTDPDFLVCDLNHEDDASWLVFHELDSSLWMVSFDGRQWTIENA